ncbi:response regulator [Planctomycetota bacterium]
MIRVLVVDDEEIVRTEMMEALQREGLEAESAKDAEEALGKLAEAEEEDRPFEGVVLDICMPGRDGDQIVPIIFRRHPSTTVVMLTAYAKVDTAVRTLFMGAYQYLMKPCDPVEQLLPVLRAGVAKSRLARLRHEILRAPDFESWRTPVADIMRDAVPNTNFFLAIVSTEDGETIRIEHGCNDEGQDIRHGEVLSPKSSLVRSVFRNQRTVLLNSQSEVRKFGALLPTAKSLAAAPILNADGSSDGLIDLECTTTENAFNEYTKDVLEALADLVGLSRAVRRLLELERERVVVDNLRDASRSLAHHIKNPLHVLQASLSQLSNSDVEGAAERIVEKVRERVEQVRYLCAEMEDVVNRLGTVGQPVEPQLETVDLATMLRQRAVRYETLARDAGVAFRFETALGDIFVKADRQELPRALDAVVENAVEACASVAPAADAEQEVVMKATRVADRNVVEIAVSDTGPGIQHDDFQRLFDPWFSTKGHDKLPHGAGLFSAKSLILAHNGRIWANKTRTEGNGAEFVIELPVDRENGGPR